MLWSNQHLSSRRESSRREPSSSPGSSQTSTVADSRKAGEDPEVLLSPNLGIDNRMRRRFRGNKKMPKIGYGSDNTTKYYLPNGLKKFVVHNAKDLEVLLMNNRTFCAEIAHNVSSRVYHHKCRKEPTSSSVPNRSESSSPTPVEKSEQKRRSKRHDLSYLTLTFAVSLTPADKMRYIHNALYAALPSITATFHKKGMKKKQTKLK